MTDDDYVPGSMDIDEQARTYHRFLFLVRWAVVAHVVAGTTFVIDADGMLAARELPGPGRSLPGPIASIRIHTH